jgi:DNA repair protein RecO
MIDQALILKQIPLQEKKLLLTLFTKMLGVKKFVVNCRKQQHLSPLLLIEFSYEPKQEGLNTLKTYDILDSFPLLRKEFKNIETASLLLKTITQFHLEEREEISLFNALLFFLKSLPSIPCKTTALIAFQIKLLHHEGVLKDSFPEFSREEEEYLFKTLFSKTLKELAFLKAPELLKEKWDSFFISTLQT